jgi:hypothetical protein
MNKFTYALSGTIQGLLIGDRDGSPLVGWGEAYVNLPTGDKGIATCTVASDAPCNLQKKRGDWTGSREIFRGMLCGPCPQNYQRTLVAGKAVAVISESSARSCFSRPTQTKPLWHAKR